LSDHRLEKDAVAGKVMTRKSHSGIFRTIKNAMPLKMLTLALTAVAAAFILEQPDKIRCFRSFADAA
jgi:hypothetical protein